jgi:CPA2 family monovalent cation:H+ antiporter-2
MLLVTGLLVFSEPLGAAVRRWLGPNWLFPRGPDVLFWLVLTLVVLAPLVAIWRNFSALCLLYAQVVTSGHDRGPALRPVVEGVFKIVGGAGLVLWLATVWPMGIGMAWAMFASLVLAFFGVWLLRRKLVYWHSELEVGLQDVFQGARQPLAETHAAWLRPHGDWNLSVIDCVLPDLADCQGRSIAELGLRSRFGCTVVGVGRQGYMISLPSPDTVLYPRDKVLLMGTAAQVEAGKAFLTRFSGATPSMTDFDDVRMEAVAVPEHSRGVGQDLRTLSPAQNHGVQVVGIKREETRRLNPGAEERVVAGDELLVLGSPERIRAFREWMEMAP